MLAMFNFVDISRKSFETKATILAGFSVHIDLKVEENEIDTTSG